MTGAAAKEAVDGMLDLVGQALANGKEERLPGFGSLVIGQRPARIKAVTGSCPVAAARPADRRGRGYPLLRDRISIGSIVASAPINPTNSRTPQRPGRLRRSRSGPLRHPLRECFIFRHRVDDFAIFVH